MRVTGVYDGVVSAVGNYHEPNLPDIPGMEGFPGQQLHCHNYRSNASFAGKTVLVVGASFSGDAADQQYVVKAVSIRYG